MTDRIDVYDRLRAQILDLKRLPGARLTERGLEADVGVSRTPLRAALLRLEADGLVRREGRGWEVTPLDLSEVARLTELRSALETAAVRLSADRADRDAVAALEGRLGAYDLDRPSDEAVTAGTRFHVELAALCGNHFFADAVDAAMTRLARTRWLEVRNEPARRAAWEEHAEIVRLVAARDADAAASRIHDHIVGTHERLLSALDADARTLRARGLAIVR